MRKPHGIFQTILTVRVKLKINGLSFLSVDHSSHDKKIPTTHWYCIEQSEMQR